MSTNLNECICMLNDAAKEFKIELRTISVICICVIVYVCILVILVVYVNVHDKLHIKVLSI